MTAFLASFLQYLIIMVILVAVAVAGVLIGIRLRKNKDAKLASESAAATPQTSENTAGE